jgi:N-formylglutamate amidohydrolase
MTAIMIKHHSMTSFIVMRYIEADCSLLLIRAVGHVCARSRIDEWFAIAIATSISISKYDAA